MASEAQSEGAEHAAEPPAAPVQRSSTFQWGSILAAVKDHLPSLDSESSTVSIEKSAFLPSGSWKKPLKKQEQVTLSSWCGVLGGLPVEHCV